MITLGIETSCDETSLCLLETKGAYPALEYRVVAHITHSQIDIHTKYGGVYPMMAKREHAKRLVPLLEAAIKESKVGTSPIEASATDIENIKKICGQHDENLYQSIIDSSLVKEKLAIDLIAVTHGPGLEPALWVGINFANALGSLWNVPVIGQNHMEGHIVASLVQSTETKYSFEKLRECEFPAIAFLVSGGHTEIVLVKKIGSYEILGRTRDDAAGEAFDKVARMLGLPYPGGPEISKLAEMERRKNKLQGGGLLASEGLSEATKVAERERGFSRNRRDPRTQESDPERITFPRPMIDADTLDMSFAGLKTAVLYELRKHESIDDQLRQKVAKEFEDAVADVIISKLEKAFDSHDARSLIVGGGVFANKHILAACKAFAERRKIAFLPPAHGLSGDNALMIAVAGSMKETAEIEGIIAHGNLSFDK